MRLYFLAYRLLILPLLLVASFVLALFRRKVREGLTGRLRLFAHLRRNLVESSLPQPRFLVHAASMGEVEQARPVIREIKQRFSGCTIILSVFSPSVYNQRRNYREADVITYLPWDTVRACRRFLQMLQPRAILLTRYDLWPNLIAEAQALHIPLLLYDASVMKTSRRWLPLVRHFNRYLFGLLDAVCVVSEAARVQMQYFLTKTPNVSVTGDTRFDQVRFRAGEKDWRALLPAEVAAWPVRMIAGSTWPEDEAQLLPAFAELRRDYPRLHLLLAPHELATVHLEHIESRCERLQLRCQRLSDYAEGRATEVLIVDQMGILANVYGTARFAFVGGSFGPGVHNVIEPAAHGIPVFFGPRMHNSPEAVEMVECGCGFRVVDCREIVALCKSWLDSEVEQKQAAQAAIRFVEARAGASRRVVEVLQSLLMS